MTDTQHHDIDTVPAPAGPPERIGRPSRWPLVALLAVVAVLAVTGGWPLLVVVLALVISVTLHEMGHFLTAKSAGMKVTEFFLGAGPRIWSFRRGETEYGIKAVPVLAYVRIIGMNNLDEVAPEDEARSYRQQPVWRRISVVAGGPVMNFMIAAACLWAIFVFSGVPSGGLFGTAPESPNWHVAEVVAGSGAAAAGVQAGDKIVSVDGVAIEKFSELHDAVAPRQGRTVPVVVLRDGAPVTLSATIGASNGSGFLGVQRDHDDIALHKENVIVAVPKAAGELAVGSWETAKVMAQKFSPAGLGQLAGQVAEGGKTDAQGPVVSDPASSSSSSSSTTTSDPSANNDRLMSVIGAVGIGADLAESGWVALVYFIAIINLFLGVLNLVPLLPFDGGHIAIAVYEKIRSIGQGGKPYHADIAKVMPIAYGVVMVLAFIGISTMYLDIVAPVHLN